MKNHLKLFLFFLMFSGLIALDQVTKAIARLYLIDKDTLIYFHDTFRLVYVENTGAFLGMGSGMPRTFSYIVFIVVPLLFLLAFAIYVFMKRNQLNHLALSCYILILAGGTGNLIDRILHDMHVSDFMNFGIGRLRTGILNFADFYITLGIFLIIIFSKKIYTQPD
jgi:signal peptidase II